LFTKADGSLHKKLGEWLQRNENRQDS
jgi:hypothetical protein